MKLILTFSIGGGSRGGTGGSAGRPGSGIGPGYGGGRYYGGGAAVPYKSGTRSRGGISPLALGAGVGLGFGLYGLWLYSVYAYPYRNQWSYFNQTSNQQERKPVVCLCQENSDCGCDENEDQEYIKSLIGDGSYEGLNKTLISVAPYPEANDQLHIIINGTLPEGTEEAANFENTGMSLGETAMRSAGVWAVAALVGTAVFFG